MRGRTLCYDASIGIWEILDPRVTLTNECANVSANLIECETLGPSQFEAHDAIAPWIASTTLATVEKIGRHRSERGVASCGRRLTVFSGILIAPYVRAISFEPGAACRSQSSRCFSGRPWPSAYRVHGCSRAPTANGALSRFRTLALNLGGHAKIRPSALVVHACSNQGCRRTRVSGKSCRPCRVRFLRIAASA